MAEALHLPVWIACLLLAAGAARARGESLDGVYRDGELEVRLRISHLGIRTSDRLAVILEASAPAGEIIEMPSRGETLGEFRVRVAKQGQSRLSDDRARVRRSESWVLEPALPGTYTIPSLAVTSRPAGVAGGAPRRVETPAVPVAVASVIPAGEAAPALREAAGPMQKRAPWMPLLLLLILAPPGVALALRLVRRGGRSRGHLPRPGPEQAPDRAALDALRAMGPPAAGADANGCLIQEILSRYLQGRFRQRTLGRSIEEVSRKLNLEGPAATIFEKLVDQLQRARYGKRESVAGAAATARSLLEDFIRETAMPEGRPET